MNQSETLLGPFLSRAVRSRAGMALTIGCLFAFCVIVGWLSARGDRLLLAGVVGLPLALAGVILINRYFQMMVLIFPITALAVPLSFPTGSGSVVPVSMALALVLTGFWCLTMSHRGWKLYPSPLNTPLLIFGAVACISLVWGITWRDPVLNIWGSFPIVQVASLLCYLVSISATLLVGNFITTPGQLRYFLGVFLIFGGLTVIKTLLGLPLDFLTARGLWALWFIAPAYGLLIAQPQLGRRWQLLLGAMLILIFYAVMVRDSSWISGWMPGVIAVYAITFLRSRKAFLVLLIVGGIALFATWSFFQSVAQSNIDDGSLERLILWEQNWNVVRQHWLFGTGPAGYAVYYMTYYRDDARSTHNNYLDILGQFGFVGMIVWLWLVVTSLVEGWRLIQRLPDGFYRTLAMIATGGWIGAMGSMFFGDWVLPFAYNQTIGGYQYTVFSWMFLGTLISLRRIADIGHDERSTPSPMTQ